MFLSATINKLVCYAVHRRSQKRRGRSAHSGDDAPPRDGRLRSPGCPPSRQGMNARSSLFQFCRERPDDGPIVAPLLGNRHDRRSDAMAELSENYNNIEPLATISLCF